MDKIQYFDFKFIVSEETSVVQKVTYIDMVRMEPHYDFDEIGTIIVSDVPKGMEEMVYEFFSNAVDFHHVRKGQEQTNECIMKRLKMLD